MTASLRSYSGPMKLLNRFRVTFASAVYVLFWVPALLMAAFVSLLGYIGTGFSPWWSALTFLMALPFAIIGIWSFRSSAVALMGLLIYDVISTMWPHPSLKGF